MHLADSHVCAQVDGGKPAVIYFWAERCGLCRLVSPIFEEYSEQFKSVAFYKVDIDKTPDVAKAADVSAVRVALISWKRRRRADGRTGPGVQDVHERREGRRSEWREPAGAARARPPL
jgi:thiol-disulfide isomerase/thioredoxin